MGEEIFRALFNAAPDPMLLVDGSGKIVLTNIRAEQIFGYSKNELKGQTVELLIPSRYATMHTGHRNDYIKKPVIREMGARRELLAQRKDGSEFYVEISLSPVAVDGSTHIAAAIRDVSEKIKLNQQVNRSITEIERKNSELEQFAYVASHDLREPLRTIRSFVDLLMQDYSESFDETGIQSMRFIIDATDRMKDLIRELLDYGRIGQNSVPEEVDCNETLFIVREDLEENITSSKSTINAGKLPVLMGYKTELRLLFQNLISNAIKFSRKGVSPVIDIKAEKIDDYWQFEFRDNGIGIPEEHQADIFQIFKRLHPRNEFEGTGIGLAHCLKIVELHEGKIWVESEPDVGSTFMFTINSHR